MGFIYGGHIWGSYIGVIWWIYMVVLCGGQMGVIWGSYVGHMGVIWRVLWVSYGEVLSGSHGSNIMVIW